MTVLNVGMNRYRVQFRHQSKLTKRPSLFRAPMNVLTTCVVIIEETDPKTNEFVHRGVTIGHAMCLPGDNFQKNFARDTSFNRAVSDCVLLKGVKPQLIAAYDAAKPKSVARKRPKYGSRMKEQIARFLREFATDAGATADETVKINEAADAIESLGMSSRTRLSDAERQRLIEAGATIREKRSTPEGRAEITANKRSRGTDLEKAAG